MLDVGFARRSSGGVVGGESAGAMIQASWLDTSDDKDFTPADRSLIKANGRAGFNLLTGAAICPHFDTREPDAALKFIRAGAANPVVLRSGHRHDFAARK